MFQGKPALLSLKYFLKQAHGSLSMPRIVVICISKNADAALQDQPASLRPLRKRLPAVHNGLRPSLGNLLDSIAVAQPPDVSKIRGDRSKSNSAGPRKFLFRISSANLYPCGSPSINGRSRAKKSSCFANFFLLK